MCQREREMPDKAKWQNGRSWESKCTVSSAFSVGVTLAVQGLERRVLVGAEILVLAVLS